MEWEPEGGSAHGRLCEKTRSSLAKNAKNAKGKTGTKLLIRNSFFFAAFAPLREDTILSRQDAKDAEEKSDTELLIRNQFFFAAFAPLREDSIFSRQERQERRGNETA